MVAWIVRAPLPLALPRQCAILVEESARRPVGRQRRQVHRGPCALLHTWRALVMVEVGGGVAGVDGVDEINSSVREGYSETFVQFRIGTPTDRAVTDVRDAIARLKTALAASGGVEIAVYTSEDQLTLNPVLELFIYARSDQWLYILQGKGLEERRAVRTKSWRLKQQEFPPAPELSHALEQAATSLGLQLA